MNRLRLNAGVGQLLEAAGIEDGPVAGVLQGLAAQRGAAARGTVDKDGLVFLKSRVVVRALRVGAELQHAARDIDGAFELAAGGELRSVSDIDDQNIPV